MRNRHLLISALTLLLMVSVFLSSCGIPSEEDYVSMENIEIKSTTSNSDIILSFLMYSTDGEFERIKNGPSILLAYAFGEGTEESGITGSDREGLRNAFDTYLDKNRIYHGDDKPIVSYNNISLYSFRKHVEDEFKGVNNPEYSFEMSKLREVTENDIFDYINSKLKIKISKLDIKTDDGYEGYYYSISYGDNSDEEILRIVDTGRIPDNSRIYLFASISPGIGDFKFPSWSDVKYIGSFPIYNN